MKQRGVFEREPGSGNWWICYFDQLGRKHREKAGTKSAAILLYRKRKQQSLEGKKLPEKLRRAAPSFAEIARDALAYSRVNKLSFRSDFCRMNTLLRWFREYPADAITAHDIERHLEKQQWSAATVNRYRALLSLTYRLAIRDGKVSGNPARQVQHRLEENTRIRFLSVEEESALRKTLEAKYTQHLSEFVLSINTGLRLSEQYSLRWEDVSFSRRILTIRRSKNGASRHVPLNQAAIGALEALCKQTKRTGFVCGGSPGPRCWFDSALLQAKVADFSWHCLRHTFASRLVMAGVDIRTVQELLGHKTISMTVRYAHLAPSHTLAAVERLDVPSGIPSDTTTDTDQVERSPENALMLQ